MVTRQHLLATGGKINLPWEKKDTRILLEIWKKRSLVKILLLTLRNRCCKVNLHRKAMGVWEGRDWVG